VAAFRATLEEVCAADIIIHVRDIASAETDEQKQDVIQVLDALDIPINIDQIDALNKIDLLPEEARGSILTAIERRDNEIAISAISGQNCEMLMARVDALLNAANQTLNVTISASDGKLLAWVYENGDVLERDDDEEGNIKLSISFDDKSAGRFKALQES